MHAERLDLEKKKVQILQETSAVDKQFMQNATNADYRFLMSLLPFIEPLTLIEKLELRAKLQKDVHEAYMKHAGKPCQSSDFDSFSARNAQANNSLSSSQRTGAHATWSSGSTSDYIPSGQQFAYPLQNDNNYFNG